MTIPVARYYEKSGWIWRGMILTTMTDSMIRKAIEEAIEVSSIIGESPWNKNFKLAAINLLVARKLETQNGKPIDD